MKTKFRRGDRVSLTGLITYDQGDGKENIFITVDNGEIAGDTVHVPIACLELERQTFAVGDRIQVGGDGYGDKFDVLMVDGDQFVARNVETGRLGTYDMNVHDWRRVEPVDEIAEQSAQIDLEEAIAAKVAQEPGT